MADGKKYTDIDDYSNIENIIKKTDPAFNDITKRLPGPVANFAQQKLSLAILNNLDAGESSAMFRRYLSSKGK